MASAEASGLGFAATEAVIETGVLTEAEVAAAVAAGSVVLREAATVTHVDGLRLRRSSRSNTGYMGVTQHGARYVASIGQTYIGTYGTDLEAAVAYARAEAGEATGAAADAMVVEAEDVEVEEADDDEPDDGFGDLVDHCFGESRSPSPRSASEDDDDDEEDEVVAAVTSLLDGDAAELAVEVLPVSAVAADADGDWRPPPEEEEEERRVVKLCGRTPEPRGFFGCTLPLGHAGPHDLGVEGKRRRPRPQWQEDGFDSALAAAVAYAGRVDTSGAVEEEGTGGLPTEAGVEARTGRPDARQRARAGECTRRVRRWGRRVGGG